MPPQRGLQQLDGPVTEPPVATITGAILRTDEPHSSDDLTGNEPQRASAFNETNTRSVIRHVP